MILLLLIEIKFWIIDPPAPFLHYIYLRNFFFATYLIAANVKAKREGIYPPNWGGCKFACILRVR